MTMIFARIFRDVHDDIVMVCTVSRTLSWSFSIVLYSYLDASRLRLDQAFHVVHQRGIGRFCEDRTKLS